MKQALVSTTVLFNGDFVAGYAWQNLNDQVVKRGLWNEYKAQRKRCSRTHESSGLLEITNI